MSPAANTPNSKDSGPTNSYLHPLTRKLGGLSAYNSSRDWWRLLDGGPESWFSGMVAVVKVDITTMFVHVPYVICALALEFSNLD